LIGVYDADGTIRGELAYWFGARLGTAHCALCDITHGPLRTRPSWRTCRNQLPVAFDVFHRDDQPDDVRRAAGNAAPVVVAETSDGFVMLLTGSDLAACNSSPEALVAMIESTVAAHGLDWETDGPN
jgi:hypothetical protein